jgi:N-acetylglucosaminyl transferase component (Gpi1)
MYASFFLSSECSVEWIPHSELLADEYIPNSHFQGQGIWITVTNLDNDNNSKLPKLYSVYSLGCLYTTSCYMVQYRPVNTDKLRTISVANNNSTFAGVELDEDKPNTSKSESKLVSKHSQNGNSNQLCEKYDYGNTDLEFIVAQINAGHDLFITVRNFLNNNDESNQSKSTLSESLQIGFIRIFEIPIVLLAWLWFVLIYFMQKTMDYRFLNIANTFFGHWHHTGYCGYCVCGNVKSNPKNGNSISSYSSLSDNFLVFHCLSEKFHIMENILLHCEDFVKSWRKPSIFRQNLWIVVNSSIVVILMDILLGIYLGQFFFRNSLIVTNFLTERAIFLQSDILRTAIESFKHSPLGIKLNPLITKKIGYVLKLLIREYAKVITFTAPLHSVIIKIIGCSGAVGVTVQISLIIDLIRLLTFHIMMIQRVSAVLHQFQCRLIFSLFHLFKGQKVNVLRKRLDTCEYDRMQLLFGVVFFSMSFFLLPSFAAYFYLFSVTQSLVLIIQISLLSLIVIIKDFPYYCLTRILLEPSSVTRGLRFHLMKAEIATENITSSEIENGNGHRTGNTIGNSHEEFGEDDVQNTMKENQNQSHNEDLKFEDKLVSVNGSNGNISNLLFSLVKSMTSTKNKKEAENRDIDKSNNDDNEIIMNNLTENLISENHEFRSNSAILNDPDKVMITPNSKINSSSIAPENNGNLPKSNNDSPNLFNPENDIYVTPIKNSGRSRDNEIFPSLRSALKSSNLNKSLSRNFNAEDSKSVSEKKKEIKFSSENIKSGKNSTNNNSSRFRSSTSIKTVKQGKTVRTSRTYLLLAARPLLAWKLFLKYIEYLSYFTSKEGLFVYFFNGILYGSPPLDFLGVKNILQFNKNYLVKGASFENTKSSASLKSFYVIFTLVFEYEKQHENRQNELLFENPESEELLINQDNENEFHDAENQINSKNKKRFSDTKVHRKLNKILFMYVLMTYVLCLVSAAGGFTLFIFSVSAIPFSKYYFVTKSKTVQIADTIMVK